MRRRRMAIAAGAMTMAVAVGAGLAMSGSATARGDTCPDGKLCIWENNEGGGQQVNISGKRGISNKLANKMNNEASSLVNATDVKVFLYDRRNAKGESRCFFPGDEVADLGADSGFNDIASSTKVARGETCPGAGPPKARGGGCPEGKLCLWADNKGGGQQVNIRDKRGVSNKLANMMNNEASSLVNETEHRVYLYDKRDAKGDRRCFEPEAEIADLGADAGFNDIASSTKVTKGDTCFVDDPPKARRGPACPDRALCAFEHNDYAGQRIVIKGKGVSNKLFKQFDETTSSVINTRGKVSYLFSEKGGEGGQYCVEPHSQVNDLTVFNDAASSSKNTRKKQCPL